MVTLQYTGIADLVLRNPDFDDRQTVNIERIQRKTRGGDFIIYRDPVWPIVQTLSMQFSFLSQQQGEAILSFIKTTLGRTITLIDYTGRTWTGIITSPPGDIVTESPSNITAKIEFEGVLS